VSAEEAARQALASSLQRVGRGGLNEQQQDEDEEGGEGGAGLGSAGAMEERGSRSAAVVADSQLVRAPSDTEQVGANGLPAAGLNRLSAFPLPPLSAPTAAQPAI
jgi:hypothetical protein